MTWIKKTGSSFLVRKLACLARDSLLRRRRELPYGRDESAGRAGQRPVAPVGDGEFPPEFFLLGRDQADATGKYLIAREAGTDQRHTQTGRYEALDHPHAGKLHGDLQ